MRKGGNEGNKKITAGTKADGVCSMLFEQLSTRVKSADEFKHSTGLGVGDQLREGEDGGDRHRDLNLASGDET